MDLLYIWYDYRCWSKILLGTIHTLAGQGDMDLEILCLSFASKFLRSDRQMQVQVICPVNLALFYCPPPFRRKAEGHCFRLSVARGAWF